MPNLYMLWVKYTIWAFYTMSAQSIQCPWCIMGNVDLVYLLYIIVLLFFNENIT